MANVLNDGKKDLKISFFLIPLLILTAIGIYFLAPEFKFNLTQRFLPSGLIHIVAVTVAVIIAVKANSIYQKTFEQGKVIPLYILSLLIFWGGLFGPVVGVKAARSASIPDIAIYYGNGKVANATDSTKSDYYFNQITLNDADSAYVVQYGEEPGYNKTNSAVRSGYYPKSTAPRANEDWVRPATNEGQKFIDGKRTY